jgi:hypothetical protein
MPMLGRLQLSSSLWPRGWVELAAEHVRCRASLQQRYVALGIPVRQHRWQECGWYAPLCRWYRLAVSSTFVSAAVLGQ